MSRLLGNFKKGLVFVVSAPAGTGKTTLIQMLANEFPSIVGSISFTTRKMRAGEIPGVHYNFVTREEFEGKIAAGDLYEYAEIYNEYYGTSYSWVENKRAEGKHVVLVIDTQGALKLKGKCDAVFIFVMPPSIQALQERLEKRRTETLEAIQKRLEWAKKEIEVGRKEYEYIVINHNLDTAYQVLKSIFIAEEHRAKYFTKQGD